MATKSRLEKLIEVAEDLNTTMKLDPVIDTVVESAKDLKQSIKKEMELVDDEGIKGQLFETDKQTLKDETWEYLTDTLGIVPREVTPANTAAQTKKSTQKEEKKVANAPVKKKAAAKKAPAGKAGKKKAAPPAAAATTEKAAKKPTNGDNALSMGEAKEAVRKIMMANEKMTKDEIAKKLGITVKRAGDALSFLKNPKYANGRPLNIQKNEDKQFFTTKSKRYLD